MPNTTRLINTFLFSNFNVIYYLKRFLMFLYELQLYNLTKLKFSGASCKEFTYANIGYIFESNSDKFLVS